MRIKNKEKIKSNLNGYNGFPEPKKVKCSCGEKLLVKFVVSQQNWSKKNNWGYWTEREEDKKIYKCGKCLREIYSNKEVYWQEIKGSKKRAMFRVYLSSNQL